MQTKEMYQPVLKRRDLWTKSSGMYGKTSVEKSLKIKDTVVINRSTSEYYLPQMSPLQLAPPPVDSSDPRQLQMALPFLQQKSEETGPAPSFQGHSGCCS